MILLVTGMCFESNTKRRLSLMKLQNPPEPLQFLPSNAYFGFWPGDVILNISMYDLQFQLGLLQLQNSCWQWQHSWLR